MLATDATTHRSWSNVSESLYQSIKDWHHAKGRNDASAEVTSSFNSDQIERRWELIESTLPEEERAELASLASPRILDVGCGYGGISLYFASRYPRGHVVATDVSDYYYSAAERTARELEIPNIEFASENILELNATESYDVVILCGVVNFLTSHRDLKQGCLNAGNSLKPGGRLFLHTPHYWTWREPFTKLGGVHFLPRWLCERVIRRSGRRSTYRDIRLPGLGELVRMFRRFGAINIHWRPNSLWKRWRQTHITFGLQKPV